METQATYLSFSAFFEPRRRCMLSQTDHARRLLLDGEFKAARNIGD